ncbi:hypothetical protein [Thermoleophilum album]|uniref:DUF4878 domain-containing protein n=1 Tax=Thermoleophilum album TaxID=29539 RepID=A0A1H6FU66_THEAL|nr:hypothetical protein [Thermoleophilum album]SEH13942.1 hypothetical protein SAMN02745716_1414 [Thermoleophilum album]
MNARLRLLAALTATALGFALLVGLAIRAATAPSAEQRVLATVERFVEAVNERNARLLCSELLTQQFVEGVTATRGATARRLCERELAAIRGPRLRLVRVKAVRVVDDEATVRALIDYGPLRRDRELRLRREQGRWRIEGSTAG